MENLELVENELDKDISQAEYMLENAVILRGVKKSTLPKIRYERLRIKQLILALTLTKPYYGGDAVIPILKKANYLKNTYMKLYHQVNQ